jgi:hypothetical protein
MRSPAPPPLPPPVVASLILPAIFWGKKCVPVRLFKISSYPSLLISSHSSFLIFESVSCIADIHINFFYKYLYFNSWKIPVWGKRFLFLSRQNTYSSFWGFFEGAKPFLIHLGSKLMYVYTGGSCYSSLHISSYYFLLISSYYSSSYIFLSSYT